MAVNKNYGGVIEELAKERATATFDPLELTHLIDGDPAKTQQRRQMDDFVLSEPALQHRIEDDYLSYEESYSRSLEKSYVLVKKIRESQVFESDIESTVQMFLIYNGTIAFPQGTPIGIHFAMFLPGLLGHANDEQQSKWLGQAMDLKIIGCYAQTELGHGTFIRGLETTATYDANTQEFVLNSPTITSTKWWPGSLGRTANHALVVAQLKIGDKNYGTHSFLVPLRSFDDHKPLPGISVGEIGVKIGGNNVDNGYLRFNNVRIPRENMLMRHCKVLPDGTYVRPKSNKLGYATMVFVRVIVLRLAASTLASASTIAIRYSAVRKQSELVEGQPEPQILDYQAQQYKLFPNVAAAYAINFAALKMWDIYVNISSQITDGELDGMTELHALSSGLKAVCTELGSEGIEKCRLACGGHGYLQAAGFSRLYGQLTAACTYEGENTVLLLQTARYLIKSYKDAQTGRPMRPSVSYLASSSNGATHSHSLHDLVGLYQQTSSSLIALAAERLQQNTEKRNSLSLAWNDTAFHLIKCAKVHTQSFIVWNFYNLIQRSSLSEQLKAVLSDVYELYTLHWIRENSGDFLRCGSVSPAELDDMETRIQQLLSNLRPNIVCLVDAFDIRDESLNSALGCYDGQVYERLYDYAINAPTNNNKVSPRDLKTLKELMQSKL
ncbi:hypothetical protein CHUAL_007769 [Chamberlinius hualienensis]